MVGVEVDVATLRHVHDATWCSDDDVNTFGEGLGLFFKVSATVDRQNGKSRFALKHRQFFRYLIRQFTRRCQDRSKAWSAPVAWQRSRIGSPNAAVFPEPVRAWPMTSVLARAIGTVSRCTWVANSQPMASNPARRTSGKSHESKRVVVNIGLTCRLGVRQQVAETRRPPLFLQRFSRSAISF